MLKSIVQSATSGSIKLRYCNYKQINAVSLLIHKASNSNVACNRTLFGSYIGSNLFSTTGIDLSKLSANLDTTSMKIKEEVLTDNDKISAETIENTTPELFENLDFHEITGGDEETLSKFNLLLLEVDVLRQDGVKVPKSMSTDQWKELFALKSRSQRLKFLKYLWTIDMKKLSDKRKKEDRKVKYLEKRFQQDLENSTNEHIKYGFQGSTIFIRIYETSINLHYNNKLVQAMKFGQNIVIDCGYETDMSNMENKLCAKQLSLLFAENRKDREPFNVHFCNINREGVLFNQLKKLIPTIDEPHFPVNVTENHYLDLFPKEKLVYLTPHCRTELLNFNHDDVYIVGALVDKHNNHPLSLAKAKSEGIRMAQLPLDRYLQWSVGTKSLTINQVLNILLDIRTTGDWNVAFKHVPQRKIRQPGEQIQDMRKHYRRGTTFHPSGGYNYKNNRYF